MDPTQSSARSRPGGWVVVGAGVLAVMGALGFARFGYTVILPDMKEALAIGEAAAGDLATANLVGYLAASLAGGLLAARFGPRAVVSLSLFAVAGGLLLTGLAADYRSALFARLVTGVASGGANVPVMGLVAAWFPAERRGTATGIAVSGSSFGLLVTGLAVPAIIARHGAEGWRAAWLFLAAATALIAALFFAVARNSPESRRGETRERPDLLAIVSSGRLWALAGVYTLFGFSYVVYATFFVRHLTASAGYTLTAAGAMWSTVGLLSIGSGLLWGLVSDRLGRRPALVAVFALQAASFALFGVARAPAVFWISSGLFALTGWSIPGIMASAAGDVLGPRLAPGGLGLLTLLFGVGQAAGPFLAGRIAEATGSFASAFLLAGAAAFMGALGALALRGLRQHRAAR